MGMDIFAIVFGVVAIGLGGFFFINETFIKKESDSDKISADAEKNSREYTIIWDIIRNNS